MAYEQTFAMLKPGVLQRRIVGEVLTRLERKGYKILAIKMLRLSRELGGKHYQEHREKPFFNDLLDYMTSGPVVALVLAGENAVSGLRALAGPTSPDKAPAGTIRGDFGLLTRKNVIHASDSVESAAREIGLFFTPEEIQSVGRTAMKPGSPKLPRWDLSSPYPSPDSAEFQAGKKKPQERNPRHRTASRGRLR